jgi:hypothetical protein
VQSVSTSQAGRAEGTVICFTRRIVALPETFTHLMFAESRRTSAKPIGRSRFGERRDCGVQQRFGSGRKCCLQREYLKHTPGFLSDSTLSRSYLDCGSAVLTAEVRVVAAIKQR